MYDGELLAWPKMPAGSPRQPSSAGSGAEKPQPRRRETGPQRSRTRRPLDLPQPKPLTPTRWPAWATFPSALATPTALPRSPMPMTSRGRSRPRVHLEDPALRVRRRGPGNAAEAALARAGFESWIEGSRFGGAPLRYPRLMVAADELDEARQVAEQPSRKTSSKSSPRKRRKYALPTCPCLPRWLTRPRRRGAHQPVALRELRHRWSDPSKTTSKPPVKTPSETERAARQQGDSLLRENSPRRQNHQNFLLIVGAVKSVVKEKSLAK